MSRWRTGSLQTSNIKYLMSATHNPIVTVLWSLTCCSVQDFGLKEDAGVLIFNAGQKKTLGLDRTSRHNNLTERDGKNQIFVSLKVKTKKQVIWTFMKDTQHSKGIAASPHWVHFKEASRRKKKSDSLSKARKKHFTCSLQKHRFSNWPNWIDHYG